MRILSFDTTYFEQNFELLLSPVKLAYGTVTIIMCSNSVLKCLFCAYTYVFIFKRGNSEDTNRCRNICGKNGEWRSIVMEERRIIFKEPEGGMGKMTTERRVKRVVSILLPRRWKIFFSFHMRLYFKTDFVFLQRKMKHCLENWRMIRLLMIWLENWDWWLMNMVLSMVGVVKVFYN